MRKICEHCLCQTRPTTDAFAPLIATKRHCTRCVTPSNSTWSAAKLQLRARDRSFSRLHTWKTNILVKTVYIRHVYITQHLLEKKKYTYIHLFETSWPRANCKLRNTWRVRNLLGEAGATTTYQDTFVHMVFQLCQNAQWLCSNNVGSGNCQIGAWSGCGVSQS